MIIICLAGLRCTKRTQNNENVRGICVNYCISWKRSIVLRPQSIPYDTRENDCMLATLLCALLFSSLLSQTLPSTLKFIELSTWTRAELKLRKKNWEKSKKKALWRLHFCAKWNFDLRIVIASVLCTFL